MGIFSTVTRKKLDMVVASLLIVAGAFGAVHACKASVAQRMYRKAKFGFFLGHKGPVLKETPGVKGSQEAAAMAYHAAQLYPENYYFPSYVASRALADAAVASSSTGYSDSLKRAMHFSHLAVSLNPTGEEARMLYVHSLAESGRVDEAIEYWETQVVEREFWNESNHEMLARLYLRSSSPEHLKKAVGEMPFIRDAGLRKELAGIRTILGP